MASGLAKRFDRRFIVGILFGTTLLGIGYGWLALYGGISLGVTEYQREKLYARGKISDAELDDFIAKRRQLSSLWDGWLGYDDLAQATLAKADALGIHSKAGVALMPEVISLEKDALLRNPANSFAWARLAYARMIYNGPSRLVSMPLLQSIQSAPYEPSLLPSRIALMLDTKAYWPPEMTDLFPQQLERAWISEAFETTRAVFDDHQDAALRPYLESDPEKLAKFDGWIRDLRAEAGQK